ncbi:hypothetical protein, partial [Vescimonas sp.]|uniref:hypothetical protein n=1 Tax=Vescimonas sp. TaxID=2892404 RepID=UPI00307B63F3
MSVTDGQIMRAADRKPFVGKTRRVFRQPVKSGAQKAPDFLYQCDLVTEKRFVLGYDKATIKKQERGGEHENQAQSRSGDC